MARPDYYLVSVEEDPDAAAKLWHERLRRHPYGSDGLVQVSYRGQQMIQADAWDDVVGIWLILTRVADAVESRSELDDYFRLFTIEGVVRVWSGAAGRTGVRVEVFR